MSETVETSAADQPSASQNITHDKIQQLMMRLGEANIINLDTTLRDLMGPVAEVLGPELSSRPVPNIHIACCNEYGLVTQ